MANDSKFGLFVGVVLVLVVAILFYQKEPANAGRQAATPAADVSTPLVPPTASTLAPPPPLTSPRKSRETPGQTTSFVQQ